jgi:hypothetical protein
MSHAFSKITYFNSNDLLAFKEISQLIILCYSCYGCDMKKHIQAFTGRQVRPEKSDGRHRQAEDTKGLSWGGQAFRIVTCLDLCYQ